MDKEELAEQLATDLPLLTKAKHLNMDTDCMIDGAWLQSLANGGEPDDSQALPARDALVREFVDYYAGYFGLETDGSRHNPRRGAFSWMKYFSRI